MANLLTRLKVKDMELKNRIVLPPLASEKATEKGDVTDELIEHYVKYAKAEVGLIIVEHSYISPEGQASKKQLSVARNSKVEGLKKLADAIHEAGGVAGVQINHSGMAAKTELVEEPVGPSRRPHPRRKKDSKKAKKLSKGEIKGLIQKFVDAAVRVQEAGFDMVEIHGAHGYLISQFNSPLSNKRDDEYGGSLENRFRFAIEVVEAVREEVGPDFPVFLRLGADDLMEGGLTLEESKKMAPKLVEAGVDILDLSGGHGGYKADGEEGFFTYLSEGMKEVIDIPVISTGGITDPEFANKLVRLSKADLIGVGREMLKDHNWAKKAINKLSE